MTKSGKVKDVRAVGGNTSLDVSWTAQAGASSYKIQWKSGSQDWDATNRQATSTTASKTLTGLTNGTDYVVRVAAVLSGGDAAWSDAAVGRPTTTPSALKAGAITSTGATLTLTGHTGNWWVKGSGGGGYSLACAQVATTSYSLSTLTGNRSYEFAAYSDSTCTEANKLGAVSFTAPGSLSLAVHDIDTDSAVVQLHGHDGRARWSYRVDRLGATKEGLCRNTSRGSNASVSLQSDTTYTAHAYNGLSCAALERLGSVTFSTLSVGRFAAATKRLERRCQSRDLVANQLFGRLVLRPGPRRRLLHAGAARQLQRDGGRPQSEHELHLHCLQRSSLLRRR